MKQSVAVFLVALVSASAFRLPDSPQGRLTHGVGKRTSDVLDTLRLIQSQISNVKLQQQTQADDTPASLDELLTQLEAAFDALLDKLAPLLDLTPVQVAQAEADIDTLIKDLKKMGHGEMNVEGGLEEIVVDIFNILKGFGAPVQPRDVSDTTTPVTALDKLLKDLEELLFVVLPVIAPKIGLSFFDVIKVERNFHLFVKHLEGIENGTLSLIDGALYVVIDLLNIAEVTGTDLTFPTPSTPTDYSTLDDIEKLLDVMMTILARQSDIPEEKIQKIEDDLHNIFVDTENILDGKISIYNGLEALIQDIIDYFQNFE